MSKERNNIICLASCLAPFPRLCFVVGALAILAGCERLEAPVEDAQPPEAPPMVGSASSAESAEGESPREPAGGLDPGANREEGERDLRSEEPGVTGPEDTSTGDPDGEAQEPEPQVDPPQEDPEVNEEIACISFEDQVAQLVEAQCTSCHNAALPLGGLDLSADLAYQTLVGGISAPTGVPFIVPGSPEESYLMAKLGPNPPAGSTMPPAPNSLSNEEIASIGAWIEGGALKGCPPEPQQPSGDGETFDLSLAVSVSSETNGNLRVGLFSSYPSSAPPAFSEAVYGAVFPLELSLNGVSEGSYIVEFVLDRLPYNALVIGPEDIVEKAALTVPGVSSLEIELKVPAGQGAPGGADGCKTCAPGLVCGADPAYPNYCAGEAGTCGEIDADGVCLSDTLVAYCVGSGADAHLLSLDCTTNAKATLCGEAAPGTFDCVVPEDNDTTPSDLEPVDSGDVCGACAPGLGCGQNPDFPGNQCSGESGGCEGLDYAGTCLSGGVLLYCSDDSGSGTPLSVDCTMNEAITACGETSPGLFDCIEPSEVVAPDAPQTQEDFAFDLFKQVHPIMEASCSGWLCHQYSGFAQPDLDAAYNAVLEKDFADNILDAIVEGRMPAGNIGLPLCTGDPSVDTDPKCLTQEQIDLVTDWVAAEKGELLPPGVEPPTEEDTSGAEESSDGQALVNFNQIHPILNAGCSGFFCHSGGFANDNIDTAFKAIEDKGLCAPILDAVQSGAMPPGKGCTGDPLQDANIEGCLNAEEHALLSTWVLGNEEACAGPE